MGDAAMVQNAAAAERSPRLLSVAYRVRDLDASIQFYVDCLGMKLLRKHECSAQEEYASAFLGYGHPQSHFTIQMKYYPNSTRFDMDKGFGHVGINVTDIYGSLETIRSNGGKIIRDAIRLKGASTVCAFVEDPNGYEIELLERNFIGDPLCQVMLRVANLDQSISFYEEAFGMRKLRRIELNVPGMKLMEGPFLPPFFSVALSKIQIAFLGFGPENETTVLELNSIQGVTDYEKGNTYEHLVIGVPNIKFLDTLQHYSKCKVQCEKITIYGKEEINATSVFDLNGFKLVLVDEENICYDWKRVEVKDMHVIAKDCMHN